ncbi:ABC transporter permease [Streptomyces sp. MCA2]|uniref:ABC transporter permease n=1 Tax=Streptomyces sp. MCA2 TaxID=2944805 RepID=UPI002022983B|nr:ABC transporter permease [Streptomyces sp. MCA2]MCL7497109.1 ABC transporter permease [Streptomyces sp. MCA2]
MTSHDTAPAGRAAAPARASLAWRAAEAARMGWLEYRVVETPAGLLGATLPRGVLQILFFTTLAGVLAGPGHREYAFAGSLVLVLSGTNVNGVVAVPVLDKQYATFARVRTGVLSPTVTQLARALPYPVMGWVLLVVQAAVAAPLLGMTDFALQLLPWAWVYALIAFTLSVLGLAGATMSVGKRADVVAPNVLSYLVMLCSGAIVPPGRVAWVDAIGQVLPGRHGLDALRAGMAGRPWLGDLGLEAAAGLGFTVLAALSILVQARRASRLGHDDFE